jgi:peptidyl-prolyl cis-trans isomerase D
MIQWFKDITTDSIIFKGFMILMVLSFGIWGIGDVITPGADPNVAIQGGRFEVRATELQRQFGVQLDRLRDSLGAEAANDASLKKMVLDNTVEEMRQTAITNMAAFELGITVTKDRVRDNILMQESFKDETGKFSQLKFAEVLNQNQLNEQMFTKLVEDDLRQRTFLGPVGENATAPKTLIEKLFAYRAETRVADTLLVPAEAMPAPDKPSDEQVKKAYDDNIGTFTAPEYRSFSAVVLARADLVPPESLDEATVRAFYDENINSYRIPETRNISQLVFETKEQADAARGLMTPGDDLAKIAVKAKLDAPIDLGERALTDPVMVAFGDAVKLPVGEVSTPVQTDLGWHLVQSSSILPERTTPYEEVRSAVRRTIADDKSNDALYDATEKLEDGIAAGEPLAEVAKAVGARFIQFATVTRQGVDAQNTMIMDTALNGTVKQDKLLATAFSTPSGTESKLLDFEGGFYVVKVDSITPPTPKPLDTIRPDVVKLWQNQEKVLAAKALAEKIAANLAPTTTLTSVADKDKRLSYAKLGPITRFGESLSPDYVVDSKRVGPEMLTKLFSAKAGDSLVTPVLGGYVIARLKDIIPATADGERAKMLSELEQSTRNAMAQDLMQQFSTALAERYPVTLNTKVISEIGGVAP